jgi:hypothetical protein
MYLKKAAEQGHEAYFSRYLPGSLLPRHMDERHEDIKGFCDFFAYFLSVFLCVFVYFFFNRPSCIHVYKYTQHTNIFSNFLVKYSY